LRSIDGQFPRLGLAIDPKGTYRWAAGSDSRCGDDGGERGGGRAREVHVGKEASPPRLSGFVVKVHGKKSFILGTFKK
jgi:hypothetical protein